MCKGQAFLLQNIAGDTIFLTPRNKKGVFVHLKAVMKSFAMHKSTEMLISHLNKIIT